LFLLSQQITYMKKLFRWLFILIGAVVIIALVGIAYIKFMLPSVEAPKIIVEKTPERIKRGEYLANSVAVCMDCHSKRDWTKFAGPMVAGTEGTGGEKFGRELGFPGNFYSKNITPFHLKDWTDGEIYRAITSGVSRDGRALFPVMPYHYYGKADKEDIYSIIAYIRTLPEIESEVPESEADFPFSVILNTIPKTAELIQKPAEHDSIAYGGYLVNMAGCVECHTPFEKGQLVAGREFGGGREFDLPWGKIRTPNITPHATGIGNWSRELFVSRFKMYADSSYVSPHMDMKSFNTLMPWMMYSRMKESDLSSIYAYLKTLKPIDNTVEKFEPKKG
jgi:mono/diheme cytochrome c family protein